MGIKCRNFIRIRSVLYCTSGLLFPGTDYVFLPYLNSMMAACCLHTKSERVSKV